MSRQMSLGEIEGENVSLGQALEIVILLQQKQVMLRKVRHFEKISDLQITLKERLKLKSILADRIRNCHSNLSRKVADDFEKRRLRCEIGNDFKKFDDNLSKISNVERELFEIESSPPCDVYLSHRDRRILDWHLANLEFANATPLTNLSLKYWDQDDDYEFTGSHLTVTEGFSNVPIALASDLNIEFQCEVRRIKYEENSVEITCEQNGGTRSFYADAVLSTLPLGVLKESISGVGTHSVIFEPELPGWKVDTIERMGYGNLNKVVLCFERAFWDESINLFAHISTATESRGELFLFWNLYKSPVLIALVSGEAASIVENMADDVVIERALCILRSIFGESAVTPPVETFVTRWRADPFSRGSYSYVSSASSGDDYDAMAVPCKRLFFAGEHTIRNYPATVHGAILSGLREGGRIADLLYGSPYGVTCQ